MDKLLDFFDDEALSEKELIEWKKKVGHLTPLADCPLKH